MSRIRMVCAAGGGSQRGQEAGGAPGPTPPSAVISEAKCFEH